MGPIQPITYHENSETFHVRFEEYIAYSVTNSNVENLGSGDDEGKSIRIYKQSNFLEYVKAHTLASELYPNNFSHYAFNTLRHIIHLVSTVEPKVEKVR